MSWMRLAAVEKDAMPQSNGGDGARQDHLGVFGGGMTQFRQVLGDGFVRPALLAEFQDGGLDFRCGGEDVLWGGGEQMSYLALNGRRFPVDGKILSRHMANTVLKQAGLPRSF